MSESAEQIEQQWLAALRNGGEQALRPIFERYYPDMLRHIRRIVPDDDTCKDIAQEVFMELWRRREELDIRTSLGAYLRRAAFNRAVNYAKSRVSFETPEQLSGLADSPWTERDRQQQQESLEAALHRAIDKLPEKCRLVFAMSRFENLSHRAIAEKLGISVKTIENQITKAMKMLRESLRDHGELSVIVILEIICRLGA
jgi:RNA polymerase sigma-70 factor, ECF subfamily